MAEMSPTLLPLIGEVETTLPFETVKEAVHLFGEKADLKALKFPNAEKRASMELQLLRENLASTRKQLQQVQTARNQLLVELVETKRLMEKKTSEFSTAFPGVTSDGTIEATKAENEAENENGQAENEAEKENGQAENEAEKENGQAESDKELQGTGTSEDVVDRDGATVNGVTEVATAVDAASTSLLDAGVGVVVDSGSTSGSENSMVMEHRFENMLEPIKDMETLLTLEQHKVELLEARDTQEKLAEDVAEANVRLCEARAEVEQARVSEMKAREAEKESEIELSELKAKLAALVAEKSELAAASDALREELSRVKMEMAALNEAEVEGYGSSPGDELTKVRAELAAVTAAEAKAREMVAGVTNALQVVTREADSAKAAAEAALETAHAARAEAEQAKVALLTAESKLEAALRESEAAKASEMMAQAELKELAERAARKESGEQRALRDERESLAKKLAEAEELGRMKVAAAMAQADAARASEHETMTKLEAARVEVEANRALVKEALHRAETAEAAKSVIENELRRRRKAGGDGSTVGHHHHHQHHRYHHGNILEDAAYHGAVLTPDRRVEPPLAQTMARRSLDYGYVNADVSTESIAELLQLKVAAPLGKMGSSAATASDYSVVSSAADKEKMTKKKSLLPKLGSYLSRKRSSVNSSR